MQHSPCDIGMDLDGCPHDFVTGLGDFAASYFDRPRHHFPPANTWNFFNDQWGLSIDEFLDVYAAGVRAGLVLWTGEPFPTVVESWRRLKADGHRIHVITDRAPRGAVAEAQAATIHWLELHGLEYDSITFDADKTKILDIVEGRRVIMLEDRIENVVALTAAGVETYCQRRLWNEGHDFRYVEDFAEFAALAAATT